jgi:peroxiredoxin
MAKKKINNLLLRTGVATLILIILVIAVGCASSTTAESTDVPETPETIEVVEEQTFTAEELGLIVLEEGIRPPDFTLPTLGGPEITLSDFQGSYVVLNFWSTNCPPCVAEMGYFEVVGKQHPDELAILTVDIRESDSKVSDFFGDGERSFIAALDKAGEVASTYGIRYTPTTFFIDTEGNVPYAKVGAFSSQQHFEESIALLMKEQ